MNTQKKRYGSLSLIGRAEGQLISVRCDCGRELEVAKHNLLRGDHKSCGKGACKNYNRAEFDPEFQPLRPRSMKLASVRKAWELYYHDEPEKRKDMKQLAARYKVAYSTLCGIFNAVRKCGGIDQYEAKLT